MNLAEFESARRDLMEYAWDTIRDATESLDEIKLNPEIRLPYRHPFDPESWNLILINARRVLHACENYNLIDPAWLDAIYEECKT